VKRLAAALIAALLAVAPAAGQQANPFSAVNIVLAAPTTTTIKTGPGTLHSVCVNTPANTGTLTLYDSTTASGTKIGTLTSFTGVVHCWNFDTAFWQGLVAVSATAAADWTVTFR
jgi:hypothetical protein